jgi:hypothetical protein
MKTNKKMMNAIALAGALSFFALSATPAEAWELCAKKDPRSGDFRKGTPQLHKKCSGRWLRVASAEQLAMLEQVDEQDLELLKKMEMVDNDGDGVAETVRFTGVNVQVVSGSGATDGTVNGLGNLVVGYDEDYDVIRDRPTPEKSGSHNIVFGRDHQYTSWGGLVGGMANNIDGEASVVLSGFGNVASGKRAVVSGGSGNEASGNASSVSGGVSHEASGFSSSVSGGTGNKASGSYSSVSGGVMNEASGSASSVSGGTGNEASGNNSSVTGGRVRTCTTSGGVC